MPLDKHVRSLLSFILFLCVCPSLHLELSQIEERCRKSLFSACATYSVSSTLFFSPLVTLRLSSLLSFSVFLSVSFWYALLSFSICTLSFLCQCCLPVTVGMPVCLFLFPSLFLLISSCLPVCFYFSLSVCFWLDLSVCLFLPLSISLCLHYLIYAEMQ